MTAGGLAVKLQAYTGGIVAVLGTGQSTSPQTGTMVVAGGMGVAEDLYVGGVLVIQNSNLEYNTISGDTEIVRSTDDNGERVSLMLKRSRNSATSLAPVHSNDLLGKMQMSGYDGNSYEIGSQIRTKVENAGTPVANSNMGGKMTWATTSSGGNTVVDRLTFNMHAQVQVQANTQSTTTTTGSLLTSGGLSAGKALCTLVEILSSALADPPRRSPLIM